MICLRSGSIMKNIGFIILVMFVCCHANAQQWVKLNKQSDVQPTDVCLIVDLNYNCALSSDLDSKDRLKAVEVNIVGDVIKDDESKISDALKWVITKESNGYVIRKASNKNLKLQNVDDDLSVGEGTKCIYWKLDATYTTSTITSYYGIQGTVDQDEFLCTYGGYWKSYDVPIVNGTDIRFFKYDASASVPSAPIFSKQSGIYTAPFTLTISAEDGAEIYYTVDGSDPSENSLKYVGGLEIDKTMVIKAIAIKNGVKSEFASAEYQIEDVSELEKPDFSWNTTQFTADLSATDIVFPVLRNNSDGSITYHSSDVTVASIDANGRITLRGEGSTVISAVVSASANYLSARSEYKLTVTNINGVQKPQAYVVKDGDQYYAMGNTYKSGSKSLNAYKVQVLNGCVVNTLDDKTILTWYVDKENGTIKSAKGLYVTYGGDDTSLILGSSKYTWAWDVENGYWYDKSSKRIIDLSDDKTYFRCYQTSYSSSRFMPVVDGYSRKVTEGRFGTICLPYNVEPGNFGGATFHRISGKRMDNEGLQPTELVLSAPVKELEAGEPYVFLPTSDQVVLVYGNESADQAKENNGLIGTFDGINSDNSAPEALRGMYLFSDNKLKKSGSGGKISKNRAYVDMSKVPVLDAGAEVNGLYFSLDDGSVTVISEYNRDEEDRKYDVYSLSGVLVRHNVREDKALEGLPAGIYLLNGKKYLVK